MDSRIVLLVVALLAVASVLSGCLDDGDDEGEDKKDGEDPGVKEPKPGPGSIRGVVTGFEGPLEGARVDVSRVFVSTVTDAQGAFEFEDVPPGEYRVSITMDYYLRAVEQVQVTADEQTVLDVEMELRMLTEEVPLKYGKRVDYVSTDDTLIVSGQVPIMEGTGVTVTNRTMNHTFPGFWAIQPEPDYLVAQLDVLVGWFVVDEHTPQPTLGLRYFRGEGPVDNEFVEGETTEHHAPAPTIDYHLVRYYRLINDDWRTWGPRDWQVGVVVEDFDETLPGGAAIPHVVQIQGVLVAKEYADAVS